MGRDLASGGPWCTVGVIDGKPGQFVNNNTIWQQMQQTVRPGLDRV